MVYFGVVVVKLDINSLISQRIRTSPSVSFGSACLGSWRPIVICSHRPGKEPVKGTYHLGQHLLVNPAHTPNRLRLRKWGLFNSVISALQHSNANTNLLDL